MLRTLAGLMQQVVAVNEHQYQNIVVALQQVTSRLRESQTGLADKVTSCDSKDRKSRASFLELKVRQPHRDVALLTFPCSAKFVSTR